MFERFEAEVTTRAKRAAQLASSAARLAKRLQTAADGVDLHDLRQRTQDAVARAQEAAAALAELEPAVRDPEVLATSDTALDAEYAQALAQACAKLEIPLEGSYPDYRVFPFDVRIRLNEHRALLGRRSIWTIAPEAVAQAVKRERDRLYGASFAADRFGASLARAYDIKTRPAGGSPPIRLTEILEMFQLGTFGRNSYTRDEFAFDIYRFRQTTMRVGDRLLQFCDLRGGQGISVPTARGTQERLMAIRLVPTEVGGGDA